MIDTHSDDSDAPPFSIINTVDQQRSRVGFVWRISIVFITVTFIWLFVHILANTFFGEEYSRSAHIFRAFITSLLVIPMIVLTRRYLDRRPWEGLKLQAFYQAWRPFLIGIVCWLIPAVFGVILCVVMDWTEVGLKTSPSELFQMVVGIGLLVFIYEALPEEMIFRGYIYKNLASAMPRWLAVLIQAILFVLWGLANGGENSLDRSILFFVAAIVLGIFRVKTDSVWASIGFHLAFQTVAQLFGNIGNQFFVSDPQALTVFAFGILPFATGITLLNTMYKSQPDWFTSEPDTSLKVDSVASTDEAESFI